jgi:hypothetical protein
MDNRGLRRTGSLPDFTATNTSAEQHWSSTTSLTRIPSNSYQEQPPPGLAPHQGSEEEGLELLIHGSPIGRADSEETADDERLLDYDSDCEIADKIPPIGSNTGGEVASCTEAANSNSVCGTDSVATAMDTDLPTPGTSGSTPSEHGLDALYFQCRSARLSSFKDNLISVSHDESFGKKLVAQSPLFGSLEDHGNLDKTFHGSRTMRGNEIVNQSISSSFDPAKLMCVSCSNEHPIFDKTPVVIMFSDQNLVPTLSGNCRDCIHIVRLENASLLELFELANEMLGEVTFQEGSLFMFGSGSHLGRFGSAVYARDWTDVVARSSAVWRGIRVSPLIPLIVTECPGSIVRDASEFGTWLDSVYDSNPLGMNELWMELVAAMEENSMGAATLETMDSYKCVFPSTLHSKTTDKVITFCSNNSRPVTFKGLPKGRCRELLGNLLGYLSMFPPREFSRKGR